MSPYPFFFKLGKQNRPQLINQAKKIPLSSLPSESQGRLANYRRREDLTLFFSIFILFPIHPYCLSQPKMFNKWLTAVNLHNLTGLKGEFWRLGHFYHPLYSPPLIFPQPPNLSFSKPPNILKTSGDTPAQELTADRTLTSSKPKADTTKEQIFLLQDKGSFWLKDLGDFFFSILTAFYFQHYVKLVSGHSI